MQATINLIGAVENGVSKATGKPWQCMDVVFEFKDSDGYTNTLAARTFRADIIEKLKTMCEGDEVEVVFFFNATAHEFTRKDGREAIRRGNDAVIRTLEPVSAVPEPFC